MNKFCGKVGFSITEETAPGVWEAKISDDRIYYGDIIRNGRRLQMADKLNDDIVVTNQISILADPYAYNNFMNIKYVEWLNAKWKVSDAEVQSPRLILTLGGIYNDA